MKFEVVVVDPPWMKKSRMIKIYDLFSLCQITPNTQKTEQKKFV
jgi:hypothetical protein